MPPRRTAKRKAATKAEKGITRATKKLRKDEEESEEEEEVQEEEEEEEVAENGGEGKGKEKDESVGGASSWTRNGTLLILDGEAIKPSAKIASFDMDDTLITPKSGRKFATGRADWKWLFPEVPTKLKELYEEGFKLVIFSNQAGIETGKTRAQDVQGKIKDIVKELGIPIQAFLASCDDEWRKPRPSMWEHMVQHCNGGVQVDMSKSFYCGDAAGRPAAWDGNKKTKKDFSCSDRKFAANVDLNFLTPEMCFHGASEPPFNWEGFDPDTVPSGGELFSGGEPLVSQKQELILFVGFPASGKSTFARKHFVPHGYVHVNQDTLKTKPKCLKATEEGLAEGKSVVVDNTNPDAAVRAEYISIAQEHGVPVRCFHFQTPLELAQHLNIFREKITNGEHKHVPRIGYAMFKKRFQEPSKSEGFTEIKKINFVANFESQEAEKLFRERT
ncbi:DNA kinase/phosphatase Pnk1 [Balamuthia mandrillaris]